MDAYDPQESPRWRQVLDQLARDLSPAELVAVERYVRALDMAERAWSGVPESLTALGSTGQLVAHPLVAVAQRQDAEAHKFGMALGVEPTGKRAKAGRPTGSAPLADLAPASKRLRALK